MGKLFGKKIPCTMCSSSDGLQPYVELDGSYNATCYVCRGYDPDPFKDQSNSLVQSKRQSTLARTGVSLCNKLTIEDICVLPTKAITERKLDAETCRAFGVVVALSPIDGSSITSIYTPQYDQEDKLSGYKEKVVEGKKFYSHGNCKGTKLFGQNRGYAGKTLYITEGEIDALTVWQVLRQYSKIPDWNPAVWSIGHGAASAKKDVLDNYEAFSGFDKVVIIFDQDEAGRSAAIQVAKVLPGKSYLVSLNDKDPSAMLQAGRGSDLYWAIQTGAKEYKPDGIVNGADTWDRFRHSSSSKGIEFPETWTVLNERLESIKPGTVVTITSGSGSGKTTFLEELKRHVFLVTDDKIADMALEQDVGDSVSNQISLQLNQRVHLKGCNATEKELKEAHDYLYSSERWSFYDHFGGMDDETLFEQITFFAASGHKYIFLDHLNMVISEFADQGSERERIDSTMAKLAKTAKAYEVTIFLVVHLRKTGHGLSFENGAVPTLDDLRGSGTIKQYSWDVIGLSRNQQHEDTYCANTSLITVLKSRSTGRTGAADYLNYSQVTGRMNKTEKPLNYDPEPQSNVVRMNNKF